MSFATDNYMTRYRARTEQSASSTAAQRRTADEWDAFASEVQESACLDELGLEARHLPGRLDIGIYDADNHRVGTVWDGRARVDSVGGVSADFLTEGEHWTRLHGLLADLVHTSVQADEFQPIADEQMTVVMMRDASPETVARAKRASSVIWDHFRGLACPIELAGNQFTTTFWPTTEHKRITGIPFKYAPNDGTPIYGRLCPHQSRGHEIIPIAASLSIDNDTLLVAWVVALCELAHLIGEKRRGDDAPATPGEPDEPGDAYLRAVSSAFVRPHIRRLREGQHATQKAITNAEMRGVELKDGETFVTGHLRHGEDRLVQVNGWMPSIRLDDLGAPEARAA
jgi:hypothetical protein